ncbi:MAG TPA: 5'-nucleotidase C-terminal domain-containing protein, partial [Actinomycetota bacterium]|nr:5'-nucleotidase C-terminal domain-containing protein [Actinomycetota bacterium]
MLRRCCYVLLLLGLLMPLPAGAAPRPLVEVQVLSISDWHGQLDPISVAGTGNVGGAAVLSSYWKAERSRNPNTLTLTAGDAFGATPPLSSFFDEEPTVKAMNLMGLGADTLGNHNFDRGLPHLQRMIDLARFPFVAANLRDLESNLTGVSPYVLREVAGVTVGIVGVTNPDAASLVFPGRMGALEVTDPVPAANRARAAAQAAGAKITIAITHMGVTGRDASGAPTGPLVDFANGVGGFDLILGDHTDVQFSGVVNGQLVVENRSKGVTYARTTLGVDILNGRVARSSVEFVTPVAGAVTPDPEIETMLRPYRSELSARNDVPIGVAEDVFVRGGNERIAEAAIGNIAADSMRQRYGTQIAFTNGGGLRAGLPSSYRPRDTSLRRTSAGYAAGPPYDLVVGDVYAVLPFGNAVVTRTLTGAQLHAALELSVSRLPA